MPVIDGTSYNERTPAKVIEILERSRSTRERIRIHYGDATTGRDWLEEHSVTGHISRSTGSIKIPLMIASAASSGGPGILDHCIVKIRTARGGAVLWQHPLYHHGKLTLAHDPARTFNKVLLPFVANIDGWVHAAFANESQRTSWIAKMGLTVSE